MRSIAVFRELVKSKVPGPSPSFSIIHLLKAFEVMVKKGPIGRGKLASELKIGEGATRTLVDKLREAGLVEISRSGCFLTKKGEELWEDFKSIFPRKIRLNKSDLTVSDCNVAVQVKGYGNRVKFGIKQRDAAIKVGASGATTLIYTRNRLILPSVSENVSRDFPKTFNQITRLMKLEDGDAVVIGSADNWEKAEYGALAAALSLVEDKNS